MAHFERRRMRTWVVAATALAAALTVAACGTRLPRTEIEAAVDRSFEPGADPALSGSAPMPAGGDAISNAGNGAAANAGGSSADPNSPVDFGGHTPATKSTIRLGSVGTYTGIIGSLQAGGRETAKVWERWINDHGGLNGHPVELIVVDDGGDPARNASAVRDLVENRGVIAFVGNFTPLSLNGSRDYLEQNRIPVVGGDVSSPEWYDSPMLFPQASFSDSMIRGLADIAVKSGKPKMGLLYCGEADPCVNARRVLQDQGKAAEVGAELVFVQQVSIAQPSFTTECIQARNKGVQIMFVASDDSSLSRVAASCAQQNYFPDFESGSLGITARGAEDPNLDGKLIGTVGVFPWMATDTPMAEEYRQAMATYAPSVPSAGTTALMWTAGKLMEKVSVNFGDNPTTADVLAGLYAIEDETLNGLAPPLTFRVDQPAVKSNCYFVVKVIDGDWSAPNGSKRTC